jgi:hypothetical protein
MARKKKPAITKQLTTVNTRVNLQDSQEWRETVYDYYKQLLTLSTAGIAVVLAIYEQNILEKGLVQTSLGNFALSAFFSLLGMMRHVGWFPYQRENRRPYLPFMAYLATFTLVGAIGLIVADALDPPSWLMHTILAITIIVLVLILFGERIREKLSRWRR